MDGPGHCALQWVRFLVGVPAWDGFRLCAAVGQGSRLEGLVGWALQLSAMISWALRHPETRFRLPGDVGPEALLSSWLSCWLGS